MLEVPLILTWAGAIAGTALLLFWILSWLARRTPNSIDDVIVGVLQWPVVLFLLLTAIVSLTNASAASESLKTTTGTVCNILRIGVVTWVVWRLIRDTVLYYGRELAKRSDSSFDDVLVPVLDVLAPVVVVGVGGILIMRLLGADLSTVALTTGGAAVVVGLALRDTIGNILGGLMLLIDTPFRFGDLVVWEGVVCQIRRIGLRVTTLYNTEEHSDVYVPNSVLAANKITNLTRPSPDLRITLEVLVPDQVRLGRAECLLLEVIDSNPYILGDLRAKLAAMRKTLAESGPQSPRSAELRWGISALSRELQLDRRQGRMVSLLDRLLVIIRGAEKGGLSKEEQAQIAQELNALDEYDEKLKDAMLSWAKSRTRDPHLKLFPDDRKRLVEDAQNRNQALARHTDKLRAHLKTPSLYEMQRLDDLVGEFRNWLPASFKAVTPAWKYPLISLKRSSVVTRTLHVAVYVDDIHLEGFVRRQRVITTLNAALAARLRKA